MTLNISNALSQLPDFAETTKLDCGPFDVVIRPANEMNELFTAALARKQLKPNNRDLSKTAIDTLTGSVLDDDELFFETVMVCWGDKPLKDDDGKIVDFSKSNLKEIFSENEKGRRIFKKIKLAAMNEATFQITEEDLKN